MLTSAHSLDLQSRQRSQLGWHFLGVRKLQNSSRYSTLMNRKEHIWDLCDKVQRDLKLAGLPVDGFATDGTLYPTIKAMWSTELGLGGPAAQTVSRNPSCNLFVSLLCCGKQDSGIRKTPKRPCGKFGGMYFTTVWT